MTEPNNVVNLRVINGERTPAARVILSCHCGSVLYELAGTGRDGEGIVRCARCRCLKEIAWRFTGEQPDPVRA